MHYSCLRLQEEVVEELFRRGQKSEFAEEVVAQVAYTMVDTLSRTWPSDLLQYAKHAKRSVVNVSDLKLHFRRNECVLSLIDQIVESSPFPVKLRQPWNTTEKTNLKSMNHIETNEDVKETKNLQSGNKNAPKLTDFWDQPSANQRGSSSSATSFKCASELLVKESTNNLTWDEKKITSDKDETIFCETTGVGKSVRKRKAECKIKQKKISQEKELEVRSLSKSVEKEDLKVTDVDGFRSSYLLAQGCRKRYLINTNSSLIESNRDISDTGPLNPLNTEIKDMSRKESSNIISLGSSTLFDISNYRRKNNRSSVKEFDQREGISDSLKHTLGTEPVDIPVMGREPSFMSSGNEFCVADELFSAFKFDSDEETNSKGKNDVTNNKTFTVFLPSSDSKIDVSASFCGTDELQGNSEANNNHTDLNARIFDF